MRRWRDIYADVRALPLRQAGRFVLRGATKQWRLRQNGIVSRQNVAAIDNKFASSLGRDQSVPAFLKSKFATLCGFPIGPEQRERVAKTIRDEFPHWVERCVRRANAICENRVCILGHDITLENNINWRKDYLSGVVWPTQLRKEHREFAVRDGADIKFVWELSRFHQGATLGRAYALVGDERYAEKFVSLFLNWKEENSSFLGPNWLCAMEVAIRAVNLIWAGALMASSPAFNDSTRENFAKSLLAHGVFIRHHLEYNERVVRGKLQPVNGNHYLTDLAGLLYISCAFPEYRYASEWREFSTEELFREIRSQIDDEGVHWEYSPNYHRLVLEMILACLILLERQTVSVPNDILDRVIKMLDFVRHYRKPSGDVPLVRDIDNGRFCILGDDELISHDHVLALGALFSKRPEVYTGTLYEDCLWYLGPQAYEWHKNHASSHSRSPIENESKRQTDASLQPPSLMSQVPTPFRQPPSPSRNNVQPRHELCSPATGTTLQSFASSRLFRQSGFAVMRSAQHYLLAICCAKGMQGYCGHTHNDFLSFELESYGRTFITDCGSFVYTKSPEWRNKFRSTLSHNTIVVDSCEQNQFSLSELTEIDSRVRPEVRLWNSTRDWDMLEGHYTLVLPSGSKVTHERRFIFLKERQLWLLRDRVTGCGRHTIETRFHFGEGVTLEHAGDGVYRTLCASGPNLFLKAVDLSRPDVEVSPGWLSKTYAAKQPIQVLRFSLTIELPIEQRYVLASTRQDSRSCTFPVADWDNLCRMEYGNESLVY